MKYVVIICAIFLAFGFSRQVYVNNDAEARLAPRLLNYQGYLTDTLGNPITNPSVSVTFGIWSSSGGGTQLWYETQPVSISRGIFSVLLGTLTPIPDSVFTKSTDRWMELTVAGITLAPRTRIVSAGYALSATYADTAFSVVDNAITTPKILDTAVTMAKIAPAGAGSDQVIKWTGTAWAPGADMVGADADWNYHITDTADTTLQMGGQWGLARAGNMLFGNADSTHTCLGIASITGTGGQNHKYCTVSGGFGNTAQNAASTVCGGLFNTSDVYAVVAGGYTNRAIGPAAAVVGGYRNYAGGDYSFVGGGFADTARAHFGGIGSGNSNLVGDAAVDTAATVGGGWNNSAIGKYDFIGGGADNVAGAIATTVTGGVSNFADSNYAAIGGGYDNTVSGYSAVISGGCYNLVTNHYGVIGGGVRDTVKAPYGSVLGGYGNLAGDGSDDTAAVVVGGWNHTATGKYSYVGGGYQNTASGSYATVAGGNANTASGNYHSFIGGGSNNSASGIYAAVGGGLYNNASSQATTIGGGSYNSAGSDYSTVAGGTGNTASGAQSSIGGGVNNVASYPNAVVAGGYYCVALNNGASVAGGTRDSSLANYSFTVGNNSTVLAAHAGSAAFNGQTATASGETRVGILSKVSGSFTIDHPLDPENKILNHYFVESPGMTNIYEGEAVLDGSGRTEITLPVYFDALNRSPRIQLTGVGTSDVYVAEKVNGNHFVIGGKPGTEVYWMVTADRKDPSAEITKILMPVEQPKEGGLANRSLDDEFLVTTMAQLERMGKSDGFKFRYASEQNRYEEMKRMLQKSSNE